MGISIALKVIVAYESHNFDSYVTKVLQICYNFATMNRQGDKGEIF
jgi:hypothetical protein